MFSLERAALIATLHARIKSENPKIQPYMVLDGDSVRADISTVRGQEIMSVRAYDYEHDAGEKVEAYINKLISYLNKEAA